MQVKDNVKTRIPDGALDNTTSPITVTSINTSLFPAVTTGYVLTIYDDTTYADPGDDPAMEKVLVTAVTIGVNGSVTLTRPFAVAHTGTPRAALFAVAQHISDITGAVTTLESQIVTKQATLVSGTTIKTVNGASLLGPGDITITAEASPTNLSTNAAPTTVTINSDTGTDAVIEAATGTDAGLFLPAQKTKLDGIATGATANSSDAALVNRANHTGTQLAETISDFDTAVGDSTAIATATAHAASTSNPHSVTKAQVGLGSADNTSDANKPVSTATQTALDLKGDKQKQAVIDFGSTSKSDAKFTVTDATITATSKVMAFATWISTLGREADEIMADPISISIEPLAGTMNIYAMAQTGRVSGKYAINYQVS